MTVQHDDTNNEVEDDEEDEQNNNAEGADTAVDADAQIDELVRANEKQISDILEATIGATTQSNNHINSPPTPIWVQPKLLLYKLKPGEDGVRRVEVAATLHLDDAPMCVKMRCVNLRRPQIQVNGQGASCKEGTRKSTDAGV